MQLSVDKTPFNNTVRFVIEVSSLDSIKAPAEFRAAFMAAEDRRAPLSEQLHLLAEFAKSREPVVD